MMPMKNVTYSQLSVRVSAGEATGGSRQAQKPEGTNASVDLECDYQRAGNSRFKTTRLPSSEI